MSDITDLEGVFIGLSEFGTGYTLPRRTYDELIAMGFKDNSWGNDICPHLNIEDDDGQQFMVWVDHKDPRKRNWNGKRFYIYITGRDGMDDYKYLRETDDDGEVLRFVRDGFLIWDRIKKTSTAHAKGTTTSKEVNMAAKKKAQKKSAKKATKKAAKTATRKPAEEKTATRKPATRKPAEGTKTPLSRFVCQLLVDGKSDEYIIEEMKKRYPDKDCSQKTVSWYRFAINHGRMEKVGFPCPEDGLVNPRREAAEKKRQDKEAKRKAKAEDAETHSRKVARRKVARRKKS